MTKYNTCQLAQTITSGEVNQSGPTSYL